MVRRLAMVCGVLLGVLLAWPAWSPPWARWQAHRVRQSEWQSLTDEVQALRQRVASETARLAASPLKPLLAPLAVSNAVRDAFVAQGMRVVHIQADLPQALKDGDVWLCPVQVQAQGEGEAQAWLRVWQHMLAEHPGVSVLHLFWGEGATPSKESAWQMQLALPCAVRVAPDTAERHDPFSAVQWQALQAQGLFKHPDARAVQRHWSEPASPLTRVPLAQWHYVGFMHNVAHQVALLQRGVPRESPAPVQAAPNQTLAREDTVHVVQVGQSVGTHWGEVTRIDPEAVTVHEWLRDASGVWRRQRTVLPLQKDVAALKTSSTASDLPTNP